MMGYVDIGALSWY